MSGTREQVRGGTANRCPAGTKGSGDYESGLSVGVASLGAYRGEDAKHHHRTVQAKMLRFEEKEEVDASWLSPQVNPNGHVPWLQDHGMG